MNVKIKFDRVLLSLLAGLGLLALIDQEQAIDSALFTVDALISIAPFIALAVLLAAFLTASGADQIIARVFSGNPVRAIVMAALVGATSPFCSCGVIPLIAAMLASGVPLAPVMAFWIASPIMDPEMFVLTSAGVGVPFAMFKTGGAVFMGSIAGFSILLLQQFRLLPEQFILKNVGCDDGCATSCAPNEPVPYRWRIWDDSAQRTRFLAEIKTVGLFLLKWLTLAFFLESLMLRYVSPDLIVEFLGNSNSLAIPTAALVGIPSYLNGYAAIPLTSGLIDMGIAKGAAMAFVTSGAVTSMPAAIAVYALVRKPVFFTYLALGLIGSILVGYAYQLSPIPVF